MDHSLLTPVPQAQGGERYGGFREIVMQIAWSPGGPGVRSRPGLAKIEGDPEWMCYGSVFSPRRRLQGHQALAVRLRYLHL